MNDIELFLTLPVGAGAGADLGVRFRYPLYTILNYPFLVDRPLNFSKGKGRRKMAPFLLKFSKKCLKTLYFWPVDSKFGQNSFFIVLWGRSENHSGRPKKKVVKILKTF